MVLVTLLGRMTVVGNPFWMAPEMMNGQLYSNKVDVFSFGIITCETMARVTSDPDILPRTRVRPPHHLSLRAASFRMKQDFGVDWDKLGVLVDHECPAMLFQLAVNCCTLDSEARCVHCKEFIHNDDLVHRPEFDEVVEYIMRIESSGAQCVAIVTAATSYMLSGMNKRRSQFLPPEATSPHPVAADDITLVPVTVSELRSAVPDTASRRMSKDVSPFAPIFSDAHQ